MLYWWQKHIRGQLRTYRHITSHICKNAFYFSFNCLTALQSACFFLSKLSFNIKSCKKSRLKPRGEKKQLLLSRLNTKPHKTFPCLKFMHLRCSRLHNANIIYLINKTPDQIIGSLSLSVIVLCGDTNHKCKPQRGAFSLLILMRRRG